MFQGIIIILYVLFWEDINKAYVETLMASDIYSIPW